MKVSLERVFPMPASAERSWGLLQDVERVAACMPGAAITERIDDRHYKGTVAVRLGPANVSFRGELMLAEIDPASHTLHLTGKGTDTAGGSAASLDLTARVEAVDATSSNLAGKSEASLSGRVATFGGRMAEAVAEQVLQQFAANFAAALQADERSSIGTPATAGTSVGGERPAPARPATPLNGLALLWGALRSWLRSTFGWRRA